MESSTESQEQQSEQKKNLIRRNATYLDPNRVNQMI